jgi:hypothetical protein
MNFTLDDILDLTRGRSGKHDVACPACGPEKSRRGFKRTVLRIWQDDPKFATYHCARCGIHGFARDGDTSPVDIVRIRVRKAEAEKRDAEERQRRHRKAQYLWGRSSPIRGSIAESYLRKIRGIQCALPPTLRFLPPSKPDYHPALIAGFGFPAEHEAGNLHLPGGSVVAVQMTFLKPDGSGKAENEAGISKLCVGHSAGTPIVIAPANDGLGLTITEGIEDALSAHEATGLGAWAATGARKLPALAAAVPYYVEAVTVIADGDPDGIRFANELSASLSARSFDVSIVTFTERLAT